MLTIPDIGTHNESQHTFLIFHTNQHREKQEDDVLLALVVSPGSKKPP